MSSSAAELHAEAEQLASHLEYFDENEDCVSVPTRAYVNPDRQEFLVHNFAAQDAAVRVAIAVQRSMRTPGDADKFFAKYAAADPASLPSLLVFYARSDKRTGRFVCAQTAGKSLAITLVHDGIHVVDPQNEVTDTISVATMVSEILGHIVPNIAHTNILNTIEGSILGTHDASQLKIIRDAACLFDQERLRCVKSVLKNTFYCNECDTALPDADWVAANLKGGAVVPGAPPGCRAWTCHGGDVALVVWQQHAASQQNSWARTTLTARVVVSVKIGAPEVSALDKTTFAVVSMSCRETTSGPSYISALVLGSTWTHVVHVLDSVVGDMQRCRIAIIEREDWSGLDTVESRLIHANTEDREEGDLIELH
jgi:hypothetical protein